MRGTRAANRIVLRNFRRAAATRCCHMTAVAGTAAWRRGLRTASLAPRRATLARRQHRLREGDRRGGDHRRHLCRQPLHASSAHRRTLKSSGVLRTATLHFTEGSQGGAREVAAPRDSRIPFDSRAILPRRPARMARLYGLRLVGDILPAPGPIPANALHGGVCL